MAREERIKPETIHCKHLILCEGKDDFLFLCYWLNSSALSDKKAFSMDFQVLMFDGTGNLPAFLDALKVRSGYSTVESILVIRDADNNAEATQANVISAFAHAEMPIPTSPHKWQTDGQIMTGFLLFPSCTQDLKSGTLEDLCLQILRDEKSNEIIASTENYFGSLKKAGLRTFPHERKAKLHTYFSVTDDYISLKVGEAARAGAFDWRSQSLSPLRAFLEELLERSDKGDKPNA